MITYFNTGQFNIIPVTTGDTDFVISFFKELYRNAQDYIDFELLLKYEIGIHKIRYIPETETRGRTHTAIILIGNFDVCDNNYSYKAQAKIRNYNLIHQYI